MHRIGRTARLGAEGDAISFACERYAQGLPDIEAYIEQKIPVEPVTAELLTALPRAPRAVPEGSEGETRPKASARSSRKRASSVRPTRSAVAVAAAALPEPAVAVVAAAATAAHRVRAARAVTRPALLAVPAPVPRRVSPSTRAASADRRHRARCHACGGRRGRTPAAQAPSPPRRPQLADGEAATPAAANAATPATAPAPRRSGPTRSTPARPALPRPPHRRPRARSPACWAASAAG